MSEDNPNSKTFLVGGSLPSWARGNTQKSPPNPAYDALGRIVRPPETQPSELVPTSPKLTEIQSKMLSFTLEDSDESVSINVPQIDGQVYVTQKAIEMILDLAQQTVSEHIQNILNEGEVQKSSIHRFNRYDQTSGKHREILCYPLEMFVKVAQRATRSERAAKFRKWADENTVKLMTKGVAIHAPALKNAPDEVLDEATKQLQAEIAHRMEEKGLWDGFRALFTHFTDYDPKSEESREFYRRNQNRFLQAVTGKKAGELVLERCDENKPNCGMTAWVVRDGSETKSKKLNPQKSDVTVGKNYLERFERDRLNRIYKGIDFALGDVKERFGTLEMALGDEIMGNMIKAMLLRFDDDEYAIPRETIDEIARNRWDNYNRKQKALNARKANAKAKLALVPNVNDTPDTN